MDPAARSLPCAKRVAIIGAGPAGLMAAEVMAQAGMQVDVYDAMPSAGRKFLLAGKGGLNLTHSEAMSVFTGRYGARQNQLAPMLAAFGPGELRAWAGDLGVPTFVGSSGRVFPTDLKAAPLLRAWLHRLRAAGVRFHMRHRWLGFAPAVIVADGGAPGAPGAVDASANASCGGPTVGAVAPIAPMAPLATCTPPALRFSAPAGEALVRADAVLLALGGASWARLGSDGAWVPWLAQAGVPLEPLKPSNCGFDMAQALPDGSLQPGWTDHFRSRFAGHPLKMVALSFEGLPDARFHAQGEMVVTETGVEGSLVYAASAAVREQIATHRRAVVLLDLQPHRTAAFVHAEVARPRGSRSLSTHLKSRLGLDGVKAGLLHELLTRDVWADPARLAMVIKALPLTLVAPRPIDEAISTAGGVKFEALDANLMLRCVPGVSCAGEMLDWEAPTGGYLLTACMASGVVAGRGVVQRLNSNGA